MAEQEQDKQIDTIQPLESHAKLEINDTKVEILNVPIFSQHAPHTKVPNMCVCCALAMALVSSGIAADITPNLIVDKALELGITSKWGGVSSAGLVKLAREYGTVSFGCLGEFLTEEHEGQKIIKSHLQKGYPVIVFSRGYLNPEGVGHAQVIFGIDNNHNLQISDSYSHRIQPPTSIPSSLTSPLESPNSSYWRNTPGKFLVTWSEFDMSWNTVDTDFSVPDWEWDVDGISDLYKDKEWRRFWLCVYPKTEGQSEKTVEVKKGAPNTEIFLELLKMGFSRDLAREAVFICEGDMTQAVLFCTANV